MTELRKAAEMALNALDYCNRRFSSPLAEADFDFEIEALRQALAQPVDAVNISAERVDETAKREHEPVAWLWKNQDGHQVLTDDSDYADGTWIPLYTAPPKREWVGLTDEEFRYFSFNSPWEVVQEIEAKLKENNT
jgi:hypothetical protein